MSTLNCDSMLMLRSGPYRLLYSNDDFWHLGLKYNKEFYRLKLRTWLRRAKASRMARNAKCLQTYLCVTREVDLPRDVQEVIIGMLPQSFSFVNRTNKTQKKKVFLNFTNMIIENISRITYLKQFTAGIAISAILMKRCLVTSNWACAR